MHSVRLPRGSFVLAVALFTFLPLAELALLVWLGGRIGVVPTLAICASTGFLGAWLARSQGLKTLLRAQEEMSSGGFPAGPLLDGACLLVGGVVLLTPGLVTDLLGFSLLLPPTRSLIKGGLKAWWTRRQGIIDVQVPSHLED